MQPEPKKGEAPLPPPTEIRSAVMDGQVLDASQWKSLEKMPTKLELITQIAVGIKANPTKLAKALKAVPAKIAYGVRALSELNEDKTMTVEAAAAAAKLK